MHFLVFFWCPSNNDRVDMVVVFPWDLVPLLAPKMTQETGQDGDLQQPARSGLGVMFRGHLMVFEKMIPMFSLLDLDH